MKEQSCLNSTINFRNLSNNLALSGMFLWLIANICTISTWNEYSQISIILRLFSNVAYLFLFCSFYFSFSAKASDYVGVSLVFLCALIAYYNQEDKHIVALFILLYCLRNIEPNKIIKVSFVVQLCLMAMTVFAAQTQVIDNIVWAQGVRNRISFGYDYCAYPAHIFLFLICLWYCIKPQNIHFIDAIILLSISYYLYIYTDSRADYYLSIVAILGFFTVPKLMKIKICRFLAKFSIIPIFAISLLSHFLYNASNPFWVTLNQKLSYRLSLGKNALSTYGIHLFGIGVEWNGVGSVTKNPSLTYNYVDNVYLKELISFGPIYSIALVIITILAIHKLLTEKKYTYVWALIVALVYGMLNAHLSMPHYNPVVLLLSCAFSKIELCQFSPNFAWILKIKQYLSSKTHLFKNTSLPIFIFLLLCSYISTLPLATISSAQYSFYRWMIYFFIFLFITYIQKKYHSQFLLEANRLTHASISSIFHRNNISSLLLFAFGVSLLISDSVISKRWSYTGLSVCIIVVVLFTTRLFFNRNISINPEGKYTFAPKSLDFYFSFCKGFLWYFILMFILSLFKLMLTDTTLSNILVYYAFKLVPDSMELICLSLWAVWIILFLLRNEQNAKSRLPIVLSIFFITIICVYAAFLFFNNYHFFYQIYITIFHSYNDKITLWGHKNFIKIEKVTTAPIGYLWLILYQYGVIPAIILFAITVLTTIYSIRFIFIEKKGIYLFFGDICLWATLLLSSCFTLSGITWYIAIAFYNIIVSLSEKSKNFQL